YQLSKKMLEHRSGTEYEDMYWIDPQSIAVIAEETESDFVGRIGVIKLFEGLPNFLRVSREGFIDF
ncbi:MAG: hypothetical protein UH242_05155, partial [Methanobrevibacter sp.]|nr:hypothetical protein [Methanobrevibacter sp.]